MTYEDYREMKIGKNYTSVGMFGENIYTLMIMSGAVYLLIKIDKAIKNCL